MTDLVPVIDQVLESLKRGQIPVRNDREIREALLVLRKLAIEQQDYEGSVRKPAKAAAVVSTTTDP